AFSGFGTTLPVFLSVSTTLQATSVTLAVLVTPPQEAVTVLAPAVVHCVVKVGPVPEAGGPPGAFHFTVSRLDPCAVNFTVVLRKNVPLAGIRPVSLQLGGGGLALGLGLGEGLGRGLPTRRGTAASRASGSPRAVNCGHIIPNRRAYQNSSRDRCA